MKLTPEQVLLFRHNGFLKLPERLPDTIVEKLKALIRRHIREEVAPIVRDREGRVVRISNLWGRDPLFDEVIACPQILDPLEALLGPNIEYITNRHNHATLRLAGEDDGTDYPHRDVMQWTRSIVTVLVYLEESTTETGCTRVIPGTHQLLPGLGKAYLSADHPLTRTGVLDQAVPVPMPAGGLLAIDSLILHAPGKNHTPGTRISMTLGYHSVDELCRQPNPQRVLVRGERIYQGNDV